MNLKWTKYTASQAENLPSDSGGIYIYVKPVFGDLFEEIVYVGQTNNFHRRHHEEHLGEQEDNIDLKKFLENRLDWSVYITIVKESDWNGIERYIYNHCLPEFNKISPPEADEKMCELPPSVLE